MNKSTGTLSTSEKVFKYLSELIDKIVVFISLFFMLIGGYTCYDNYQLFYHTQDKSILKFKPTLRDDGTLEMEADITDDLVSWITINDTSIDYPIMYSNDNTKYLNMDPYGEYSLSGSIFLDSRNSKDFSDSYNLVYGHHMENGFMFGALDSYKKKSYFKTHRDGNLIITTDKTSGKEYKLRIFAVTETHTNSDYFDPTLPVNTYSQIKKDAMYYVDPTNEDNRIIAMSTCQSAETTGRLIVFAEMISTGKTALLEDEQAADTDEVIEVRPISTPSPEPTAAHTGPGAVFWFSILLIVVGSLALYYLLTHPEVDAKKGGNVDDRTKRHSSKKEKKQQ